MATRDFFIAGDQAEARQLVEKLLTDQGYRLTATPNGKTMLERGKKSSTVWLGALAGKNFYVSYLAEYFGGQNGEVVARVTSNTAGGILGGAIGVAKAAGAYDELVAVLQQQLQASGRLVNVVSG